ncbi:MAG: helix-turn-helix transcriptional regulator [Bacteroidales bacterium]|nr:helix-turn-helix transcriptional regulator [Bacteroidales bacterium]MBN2758801.1 helix-turn-helix transcriptional regulator [Bacteroidales bacterium]
MICTCCIKLLNIELENAGVKVIKIRAGFAHIEFNNTEISLSKISKIIESLGMELIKSRDQKIIEQIKTAVIEIIHHSNNVNSIVRKSEYLVEKLGFSYQYLSKLFSKHETITLERYIILNKIERIKELIDSDEYSLSEIAYMMDYSSVQYLSNQFKKETDMSVSEYKRSERSIKRMLDNLY